MHLSRTFSRSAIFLFIFTVAAGIQAQKTANANPHYQSLRGLQPGEDAIVVSNLELKRDNATFTFHSGSFAFYGEVNGKVTGAVFRGEGHLHLTPPDEQEKHNLQILTHSAEFNEDFDQVVLRFSDNTANELRKASTGKGQSERAFSEAAAHAEHLQRTKLFDNVDLRLLEDVLSPVQGSYFRATIHGKTNHTLVFVVDPQGTDDLAPEEVMLMSWNEWGPAYMSSFYLAEDRARVAAHGEVDNSTYRIDSEDLDTTIEKSGFLTGFATLHLTARKDGVVVLPLNLHATLRVSKVETDKSEPLDFVQEKKEEDADFGVILPAPLKKGESITLRIAYGGKDVVYNAGGSNYYPVARSSWYPNSIAALGSFTNYHMLFRTPKDLQLVATGTKTAEKHDGKMTVTEWKTDVPLSDIGFSIGKFVTRQATIKDKQGNSLVLDAYANTELPDYLQEFTHGTEAPILPGGVGHADTSGGSLLQTLNTTSMLPAQLSQGQVAAQIYTSYFGPTPFNKISLTQQSACNYGQSWPTLVYLPVCGFLDSTQQHALNLDPADMYWKTVTPHEVAHQWWGQTVSWRSYRDQWMSEGFADASAAIFLLATSPKPDQYREFWKEARKQLTEKNAQGFRPIDEGPVTMGQRLRSDKVGWDVYRNLVYPKGAYILHMIQTMMWNPREGDALFKTTMQDFVSTYRLKAATTEDFKAIVEKHMTPQMDLEGTHTMDWFFREYVYGTELPNYHFESQITPSGDGLLLHVKATQSGVSSNFVSSAPLYLEFADGKVMRIGSLRFAGNGSVDQNIPLPKLPTPIKRAALNYYYDMLCTEN